MDMILLLQSIPGYGISRIRRFIQDNKLILYDYEYLKYVLEKEIGSPIEPYEDSVKRIRDNCNRLGVSIISGDLIHGQNAPLILFLYGNRALLSKDKKIGFIGRRNPSDKGIKIEGELVPYLVDKKWVVVSGLAKGCDTLAHRITLENNGDTIAVIPMGYREGVAPWLTESGLIISEYPPYTPIRKFRCVERNRIISGISKGIIVVEASMGSGSEHTMRYALKEGKPVAHCLYYPGVERLSRIKIDNHRDLDSFLRIVI